MASDFGRSEIFQLVAEGDILFHIHKDILASQSKPFREAISGVWKETTERKISLHDWDEDTVSRLVQFLYTGDYKYPDPSPLIPTPILPSVVEEATMATTAQSESGDNGLRSSANRPLTPLNEWYPKSLPTRQGDPVTESERLEGFDPAHYDFKAALLSHAKVYALAHYKSVHALRALALNRLLLTLVHLDPIPTDSHLSRNLVELASYSYSNTDYLSSSKEPLRDLISQFVALNFAALQTEPEAVELIGHGGDFVKDVMAKVCRRLASRQAVPGRLASPETRFISNLRVVRDGVLPTDCVRELRRKESNINYPLNNKVWLVQEYTSIASDACTSFTLSFSARTPGTGENLAVHDGTSCYIVPVKDQHCMDKITNVALIRFDANVLPSITGYDGISSNIKQSTTWGNDHLHLIWKTAKIPLV